MTRLTEEMVIARSKQSDLGSIKNLNCWGAELTDVSILKRMRAVEVLALSVNNISTLQDFESCSKLQELYLRKNNIQDINEIVYLRNLPCLRNLWLAENPCCDRAGSNYRLLVLRSLPNLKKLDNVEVTQEELSEALSGGVGGSAGGGGEDGPINEEDSFEEAYEPPVQQPQPHQQQQQQYHQQQQRQQQFQHQHQQQQPQRQQQSQIMEQQQMSQRQRQFAASQPHRQSASPQKEHTSSENTEESLSEPITQSSIPSSPLQRSPINQEFSTSDQVHPTSPPPKYNNNNNFGTKENRSSYHQYDRSSGSDQDSPNGVYRERAPIPPSISTHSMKEYYHSDRPSSYPVHYRHSQTDLTEWEEHQQHLAYNANNSHQMQRRSAGMEREAPERFCYRNGSASARENGGTDWEDCERPKHARGSARFSDSASVVSNAVLSNYNSFHRRPINRNSNLLSATLCLVKELDYPSLEVVEHAVRCRIDELSTE